MGIEVLEYAAPAIVVSAIELSRILLGCSQPGMNVRGIGGEIGCNRGRLGGLRDAVVLADGKLAAADPDKKRPRHGRDRLVDRPEEILEGSINSKHLVPGPVSRLDVVNPRRDKVEAFVRYINGVD